VEDWKAAHDAAKVYIRELEAANAALRDRAIEEVKLRQEWQEAYQEAMRPKMMFG
jgi:hypothetical protein